MRNPIIEEDLKSICKAPLPWDKLEGKNILIAGAAGFVPAYLAETILFLNEEKFKNKAKVFALIRNKKSALERFSHYHKRDDLEFIIQDVCSPVRINEPVSFIVHAASAASPKVYCKDPVGTLSANIIGTNNLLTLAKEMKAESFLFISSGEVYGELPDSDTLITEQSCGCVDPTQARSCYSEGKRAGEAFCVSWHDQLGVPAKIARLFHTYGPGMKLDDGRVFADFVSDVVNNRDIVMKSDGSAKRPFCYLADAAAGLFTVLLKGKDGEAYNVGDARGETSIRALAEMLVTLCPEKKLKVEAAFGHAAQGFPSGRIMRNCPDTTKLNKLGWLPEHSLREGFLRTIRSFQ